MPISQLLQFCNVKAFASTADMTNPAVVSVMAVSVAGRFAESVCPVLVIGRDAPVEVDGDAVAAASPDPTPELPEPADCIVRGYTKTQRTMGTV